MTGVHRLPERDFDDLAAGYGDAGTVARLRAGQVSRRLLLLKDWVAGSASPAVQSYLDLLGQAQRADAAAFRAIVARPHFGAWVSRARRADEPAERSAAVAYFGTLAAAAAMRARLDFEITIEAGSDGLYLPGLGRVATGAGPITVDGKAGECWIADVRISVDTDTEHPLWTPLRRLTSTVDGQTIAVELDDLDPYRNWPGLDAADRLSDVDVDRWRGLLDDGWARLVRHHGRYASAIGAGLVNIVPLAEPDSSKGVNATAMNAFGSVSLSPPADDFAMASGLLHEFQHAKLGALLDLEPLYHDSPDGEDRRYYAPWRDDPRPLGALLQGVYAFLGVTDFWRAERAAPADRERAEFAEFEFARWRDRVWTSYHVLAASDQFTEAGWRFLEGLRRTQEGWLEDPVSPVALTLAGEASDEHRLAWRMRNLEPDADRIAELAWAWRAGHPAPGEPVPTRTLVDGVRALTHNIRLDLAALRINDPQRFSAMLADPALFASVAPQATAADAAYVGMAFDEAVRRYTEAIRTNPADRSSWVGLALAARADGRQAPPVLLQTPEVPYGLYGRLRADGDAPDPLDLARWVNGPTAG